ncbi:hypothetical protein Tco_0285203 [Tanacetum coccineum]
MHTTMIPEQVKTQKIQAGVQVSRQEVTNVIFNIGSTLEVLIMLKLYLIGILFAPQLHESAGGLPKTKLVSHSCSLAGSTSAMKVSNWGGHLHFREVGESSPSHILVVVSIPSAYPHLAVWRHAGVPCHTLAADLSGPADSLSCGGVRVVPVHIRRELRGRERFSLFWCGSGLGSGVKGGPGGELSPFVSPAVLGGGGCVLRNMGWGVTREERRKKVSRGQVEGKREGVKGGRCVKLGVRGGRGGRKKGRTVKRGQRDEGGGTIVRGSRGREGDQSRGGREPWRGGRQAGRERDGDAKREDGGGEEGERGGATPEEDRPGRVMGAHKRKESKKRGGADEGK